MFCRLSARSDQIGYVRRIRGPTLFPNVHSAARVIAVPCRFVERGRCETKRTCTIHDAGRRGAAAIRSTTARDGGQAWQQGRQGAAKPRAARSMDGWARHPVGYGGATSGQSGERHPTDRRLSATKPRSNTTSTLSRIQWPSRTRRRRPGSSLPACSKYAASLTKPFSSTRRTSGPEFARRPPTLRLAAAYRARGRDDLADSTLEQIRRNGGAAETRRQPLGADRERLNTQVSPLGNDNRPDGWRWQTGPPRQVRRCCPLHRHDRRVPRVPRQADPHAARSARISAERRNARIARRRPPVSAAGRSAVPGSPGRPPHADRIDHCDSRCCRHRDRRHARHVGRAQPCSSPGSSTDSGARGDDRADRPADPRDPAA